MSQYLTLELKQEEFASEKWLFFLENSLSLPLRKTFSRFSVREKDFVCFGSWLCYDSRFNLDKFTELLKAGKWDNLNLVPADFIVIFARPGEKKFFVLTSSSGAFPCYFSTVGKKLILSTSFTRVKDRLQDKHLDVNWALDYLSLCVLLTERTVLEEIKQIPPATLLVIDEGFNYEYRPTVNIQNILAGWGERYRSRKKYANDFIEVLTATIGDRLRKMPFSSFGCDLSSGLDVNLVAYILKKHFNRDFRCFSRISEASPDDTDRRIVKEFAGKHKLKVEFINADEYFPFSQSHELNWIAQNFYPADHGEELQYQLFSRVSRQGYCFEFTGDGGDEIYKSRKIQEFEKFALQYEYFWTVRSMKGGVDEVVTKKGREMILSPERFQAKRYFPSLMPRSAVQINLLFHSIMIETGVKGVMPFNDVRMVQFGSLIPPKTTKWNLWQHRTDIFLPGQFRPKGHFQAHIDLFLTKKLDLAIQILENSVLRGTGIVNVEKILKDLREGNLLPYQNKPASVLDNLIRLEYFLQKNNVDYSV